MQVVYLGGGCLDASPEVREFIKHTNIPVASTLMGLGTYPATDPLALQMLGMHGTVFANYSVDQVGLGKGLCCAGVVMLAVYCTAINSVLQRCYLWGGVAVVRLSCLLCGQRTDGWRERMVVCAAACALCIAEPAWQCRQAGCLTYACYAHAQVLLGGTGVVHQQV